MNTTAIAPAATAKKAAAPAKRTLAKAPAKAPAKKAAKPAAEKQMYMASAKGRGGETNTRNVLFKATHGVDVADKAARKLALQLGQIWAFFPSGERATAWASKKQAEGYDCVVVAATAKPVTK